MADRRIIIGRASELMSQFGHEALEWLNDDERTRHERLSTGAAATAFVAAHLAARVCAAELLLGDPAHVDIVQRCGRCGGPHGKAVVASRPDVHVSWSHAGSLVAAVAAGAAVGIDIEPARRPMPIPSSAFHADETPSIERWCEKECLVKLGRLHLTQFGVTNLNGGVVGVEFERLPSPDQSICVLATVQP